MRSIEAVQYNEIILGQNHIFQKSYYPKIILPQNNITQIHITQKSYYPPTYLPTNLYELYFEIVIGDLEETN